MPKIYYLYTNQHEIDLARSKTTSDARRAFAWILPTAPRSSGTDAQRSRRSQVLPGDHIISVGFLRGRMVVVVYTPAGKDNRRIISMRYANDREQRYYQKFFGA